MMRKERVNKTIEGIMSENLVLNELLKRGFIATITSKNTECVDILTMNTESLL